MFEEEMICWRSGEVRERGSGCGKEIYLGLFFRRELLVIHRVHNFAVWPKHPINFGWWCLHKLIITWRGGGRRGVERKEEGEGDTILARLAAMVE